MSQHTRQFFEQLKSNEAPSLAERIRGAAGTAKSHGGQLWDGLKPMFDHGRTEVAAALFAGHAHVMYMKGQEAPGLSQDGITAARERQVEGREM